MAWAQTYELFSLGLFALYLPSSLYDSTSFTIQDGTSVFGSPRIKCTCTRAPSFSAYFRFCSHLGTTTFFFSLFTGTIRTTHVSSQECRQPASIISGNPQGACTIPQAGTISLDSPNINRVPFLSSAVPLSAPLAALFCHAPWLLCLSLFKPSDAPVQFRSTLMSFAVLHR